MDLSKLRSRMAIGHMVFAFRRLGLPVAISAAVFSPRAAGLATARGYVSYVVAGRILMHTLVKPDFFSSPRTLWRKE